MDGWKEGRKERERWKEKQEKKNKVNLGGLEDLFSVQSVVST